MKIRLTGDLANDSCERYDAHVRTTSICFDFVPKEMRKVRVGVGEWGRKRKSSQWERGSYGKRRKRFLKEKASLG